MKNLPVTFLLWLIAFALFGQEHEVYPTIEDLGWQMEDYEQPENLQDLDVGEVTYLVTFNMEGKVSSILVLSNSFPKPTERPLRKRVRRTTFIITNNNTATYQKANTGTLLITREHCSKDSEN